MYARPRRASSRRVRSLCDTVFGEFVQDGQTHAAERTPWHVYHLPLIAEVYPDARFVHIVRDGRDAARSIVAQPWGPDNVKDAAEEWRSSVAAGRDAAPALGRPAARGALRGGARRPARRRSRASTRTTGSRAGSTRRSRLPARRRTSAATTTGSASGKWREGWGRRELRDFDRVAGDLLRELGYDQGLRRVGGVADALVQRRAQPRVDRVPLGCGRGRGVAQELLDRGGDRGRLLRRGGAGLDLDPRPGRVVAAVAAHRRRAGYRRAAVADVPVYDYETVLAAVSPLDAIERVRDGFVRYEAGEWGMPPKVYLAVPPAGDFRAMPAKGGGLAILKWVTSFPGNPARGPAGGDGDDLRLERGDGRAARAGGRARRDRAAHRRGRGRRRAGARARGRALGRDRSAAACTARGRRAASPRPSSGRASASTSIPRPPARSPASSAGRRARARTRSRATSSRA